jgi:hypothetical protein
VPYIDIPIEATEPTQITIQTTNGTPQTNSGFIDSWVELWQDVTKLRADDDGAHSATNVLASFITTPIDAGIYFIRATSFAWMASNQTQFPTGNYLLTWNGVTTIQLTPTPTPTPTEIETPSPEPTQSPTEEPTPTPTATDSFTASPTPTITPEIINNQPENETILPLDIPTPSSTPEPTNLLIPELETEPQTVEEPSLEIPIVEPELSVEQIQEQIQEQIDAEYIAENTIELSLPNVFENVPGAEQLLAATEAILNVGADMTQEQREESQSVVVAAVVLTQISQMASVTAGASRTRKLK